MASDVATVEILSFGDLVQSGSYGVHSRFRRAVNMTGDRRFVSLVAPDVDAGPLNIVVRGLDTESVRHLRVEARAGSSSERRGRISSPGRRPPPAGHTVILDGGRIAVARERIYHSALDPASHDLPLFQKNLRIFGALLVELAPRKSLTFLLEPRELAGFRSGFEGRVAEHIQHCVREIFRGDTLRGVSRLKGCGFGLTPSGDDFIVGLLIATHLSNAARTHAVVELRARIFESARTSNTLSDTFLYLAESGRVTKGIKSLVASLSLGTPRDVRKCTEHLVSIGATSGVDTGVGLYLTLRAQSGRIASVPWGPAGGLCAHYDGEAQWL